MYTKTQWVDNTTPIDKDNLNKIEQGIYDNSLVVEAVTNTLNPTDTETYKTAELTEGQITDVIAVNDIIIKGDTEQDGTPTPSAPVDVNVVSGSNVINTSNKNILDISKLITQTQNRVTITKNKDNSITLNGTASNNFNIVLKENFKIPANQYTLSLEGRKVGIGIYTYVNNDLQVDKFISTNSNDNIKSVSFTTNSELTFNQIRLYIINGTSFNNLTVYPQLEIGATQSSYTSHQGKELPLDLGNIELCKIGDYQDYFYKSGSKWYLHKEIRKITLDGSEREWYKNSLTFYLSGNFPETLNALCSHFTKQYNTSWISDDAIYRGKFTMGNIANQLKFMPIDENINTIEIWKTWLSTHNVTLYYALKTPTDTEITDTTLISQLEAIYNAPLYEQTNITQTNNDLPMVLDITACKDNINGIKAFIRK